MAVVAPPNQFLHARLIRYSPATLPTEPLHAVALILATQAAPLCIPGRRYPGARGPRPGGGCGPLVWLAVVRSSPRCQSRSPGRAYDVVHEGSANPRVCGPYPSFPC